MIKLLKIVFLLIILSACSASSFPPSQGYSQCPVCSKDADLGCLNVKVTESTPRTTYKDHNYFFCSEECKADFLADSEAFKSD